MIRSDWIDLAASENKRQEVSADFCVIGAGAAGIYLANQLVLQGRNVVLLEAGPPKCVDSSAIGFDTLFEMNLYPGVTEGRFFGMGGSTSRWGGALVPHSIHDLRDDAILNDVWHNIVRTVDDYALNVLQQLGYPQGRDFENIAVQFLGNAANELRDSDINVQSGLYLPFRIKNFVTLLDNVSRALAPRVFYNAVAKSWSVQGSEDCDNSRVASVLAISRNHKELFVRADKFVVAAGAIESARILLEINESGDQRVFRSSAAIGCYLADHLSVSIADVASSSLNMAATLFAPRFAGAWLRGFRFLENRAPNASPRAFAHFIFENSSAGFELAKELMGAMQGRRIPAINATSVIAGMGDLIRLAYYRFAHSKFYITPGTHAHLQLDMEQGAIRDNRVSLTKQKDVYGRNVACIHWKVTEEDMMNIEETARRFLSKWSNVSGDLPHLEPKVIGTDGTKPYDAYHPVGTCRMGEGVESVVDLNLKVWGVRNLWVASTGVLPSAGTANPTFTLLCLTHKLAVHLQGVH